MNVALTGPQQRRGCPRLVGRVGQVLRFEAERGERPVVATAAARSVGEEPRRVELHAGHVGPHLESPTAGRVRDTRVASETVAVGHEAVVVPRRQGEPDAIPEPDGRTQVEGPVLDRFGWPARQRRPVDG